LFKKKEKEPGVVHYYNLRFSGGRDRMIMNSSSVQAKVARSHLKNKIKTKKARYGSSGRVLAKHA
jgi:hypothetical protein